MNFFSFFFFLSGHIALATAHIAHVKPPTEAATAHMKAEMLHIEDVASLIENMIAHIAHVQHV